MSAVEDDYFKVNALSKSGIDLLLDCPAYYKEWLDGLSEKRTKALEFGGMFHTLTLEPQEFKKKYAVTNFNLATKAGKEWKASLDPSITVVKEVDYEQAMLMAEAVRNHPKAQFLFTNYTAEIPVFAHMNGIDCKIKPDMIYYSPDGVKICVDLKTTEDASLTGIQKSVATYNYHRQAAWYLKVLEVVNQTCDAFLFVFVEKKAPHLVTCVLLDDEALEKGWQDCQRAMDIYKQCIQENLWPCYTNKIETISLPKWAI